MALSASSSLVSSTRSTLWLILGRVLTLHSYLAHPHCNTGHRHRDLHPPALVPAPRPVDDQRPVVRVDLGPGREIFRLKYYYNILKHGT